MGASLQAYVRARPGRWISRLQDQERKSAPAISICATRAPNPTRFLPRGRSSGFCYERPRSPHAASRIPLLRGAAGSSPVAGSVPKQSGTAPPYLIASLSLVMMTRCRKGVTQPGDVGKAALVLRDCHLRSRQGASADAERHPQVSAIPRPFRAGRFDIPGQLWRAPFSGNVRRSERISCASLFVDLPLSLTMKHGKICRTRAGFPPSQVKSARAA